MKLTAATALDARVARLLEESTLGTPGARALRDRDRLARTGIPGWNEADHDLVMTDGVLRAAEL